MKSKKNVLCGIWTHASEENGALSHRLRPLGQKHLLRIQAKENALSGK